MTTFYSEETDYLSDRGMFLPVLEGRSSQKLRYNTILLPMASSGLVQDAHTSRIFKRFPAMRNTLKRSIYQMGGKPVVNSIVVNDFIQGPAWEYMSARTVCCKSFPHETVQYEKLEQGLVDAMRGYSNDRRMLFIADSFCEGLDWDVVRKILKDTGERMLRQREELLVILPKGGDALEAKHGTTILTV